MNLKLAAIVGILGLLQVVLGLQTATLCCIVLFTCAFIIDLWINEHRRLSRR